MTNKVSFEVVGLKELEAAMKELVTEVRGRKGYPKNPMRTAIRKGAKVIYDQAYANASAIDDPTTKTSIARSLVLTPIPTKERDQFTARGDSREGYDIKARISNRGRGKYTAVEFDEGAGGYVRSKTAAAYWGWVELGTDKMRAQPYLRPAVAQAGQRAIRTFMTALGDSLEKIRRKINRENKAKVK